MAEQYLLIHLTDAWFIPAKVFFSAPKLHLDMADFSTSRRFFLQPVVHELVSKINSTNNSVLSGYQETVQSGCARIHNICKLNHSESAWSHQKVQIINQFGISGCKWTFPKLIKLLYTPSHGPPGSFKSISLISPSINSRKQMICAVLPNAQ